MFGSEGSAGVKEILRRELMKFGVISAAVRALVSTEANPKGRGHKSTQRGDNLHRSF